ncbi:putative ABC transport system ATP-binding protein [Methanohalophilus euhalobius]|jgi:putative ABC transport system ATP-binding protein|uniref:Putative ABC transport system ATP-binding protein n=1 Tax=Methanohalophilus euhalobius TaxID=51203 RepID=A0A285EZ67_9EURY|nr:MULTISPECIES: ATP-binding cassette domain-containing protein [Methanohalophilus]TCL12857.1 putative ABC transport system ATP-binding protein [Methanohalophilus euhalobius]SNY03466.1 putative ABC transport system ATP-binding protein [Methanohalophilus euhalobius]
MGKNIIEYRDLSIIHSHQKVLENFNLIIKEGEKVLIRGKSGTGKSTLFLCLLGLMRPSKGDVYFKDLPVNGNSVSVVRTKIAYVPQDVDVGRDSVNEFFDTIFSYNAVGFTPDFEKIQRLLEWFELDDSILKKEFKSLSGGEKQRIILILSLLLERNVFLLDEPTSSLDSSLKSKVVDYFVNDPSLTVVVISHDPQWEREGLRVVDIPNK